MSDKKCCVPGCVPREVPQVLHGFPNPEKDQERFNIWLMAIGGDIIGLDMDHVYKYRRVCRSHFEARFLCRNNRISNIAVPTIYLPEPAASSNVPESVEEMQVLPSCSSSQLPVTVEQMQTEFTRHFKCHLKEDLEAKYLNESMKTAMYTLTDFKFINCDDHKAKNIDYVINLFTKFVIFNHCKNINKMLAGRQEVDDETDAYQLKAKKISQMYKKHGYK